MDIGEARRKIRAGEYDGHTAGIAPGRLQGNLVILPADYGRDFAAFCAANPKPCPVIGRGAPGDPMIADLGADLDIRTDVPRYRIYRDGVLVDRPTDISDVWRDDLETFVLGCSFSFEQALLADGIALRHIERGDCAAMYLTDIDTAPAGPFRGKLVVSMRPLEPAAAIRAIEITARFPHAHGAPVHIGLPERIGIDDLEAPFEGDAPGMRAGELPVFWACGVTPQQAIAAARPPLCITHEPGCMVVTELPAERPPEG